ncbi:MAG: hypothetical protein JWN01_779 [Patescibacteria group bacterium]|nr:hypothetical protein [Patescibacteria group bacterium]
MDAYAKYSGLVAVMFEWLALALFFILQPAYFDGKHPISYFATLPQTRYIFAACYAMAALNLWIFFRFHVGKHDKNSVKIFTLSLVSFVAIAIIPYAPENPVSAVVHNSMFLVSSIAFMLGMFLVSKNITGSIFRNASMTLVALSTVAFLAYLTLRDSSLTLALETGWWLILQIWIFWVSYATLNKEASAHG